MTHIEHFGTDNTVFGINWHKAIATERTLLNL